MIIERPLLGRVDIQALEADEWVTYLPNATGVTIRRGGARDGLGVRTDVGLLTFTLRDAQDPLAGGTFVPGQQVRALTGYVPAYDVAHPAGLVYDAGGFDALPEGTVDLDGWTPVAPATIEIYPWGVTSGQKSLTVRGAGGIAHRPLSGLVPGVQYTLAASVINVNEGWTQAMLGVAELANPTVLATVPYEEPAWMAYTFIASAETHTLQLASTGSVWVTWDDVTVTASAWTEHVPEQAELLFTGRIADIGAAYPMDKASGRVHSLATVTAADAVGRHTTTPRSGALVDGGFETFEARIARLAASAQEPVDAPAIGAPREVYAF
ncbi:hypothetical protein [Agromyces archimandritae]|uniref:Uncharacterized protein n=1 Tax=Agromyces archimandritae TaxID=2781962 RepID=A0A975FLG2_9MICO|nr:hypothetical protein [Agromyces archimandritae]QTX04109.1 hypothetical protein G127AT_12520 [Agromyces archimandritae]